MVAGASATSKQVFRCNDAAVGCEFESECPNSTSGCHGGNEPSASCADTLTGKYCMLCDYGGANSSKTSSESLLFYVAASKIAQAHCDECGDTLMLTIFVFFLALAAFAAAWAASAYAIRAHTTQVREWRHSPLTANYSLLTIHYSSLTHHSPLLTTYYSLLATHSLLHIITSYQ